MKRPILSPLTLGIFENFWPVSQSKLLLSLPLPLQHIFLHPSNQLFVLWYPLSFRLVPFSSGTSDGIMVLSSLEESAVSSASSSPTLCPLGLGQGLGQRRDPAVEPGFLSPHFGSVCAPLQPLYWNYSASWLCPSLTIGFWAS